MSEKNSPEDIEQPLNEKREVDKQKSRESSKKHRQKQKQLEAQFLASVRDNLLTPIKEAVEVLNESAPRKLKSESDLEAEKKKLIFYKAKIDELKSILNTAHQSWQKAYGTTLLHEHAKEELKKAVEASSKDKTRQKLPRRWSKKLFTDE